MMNKFIIFMTVVAAMALIAGGCASLFKKTDSIIAPVVEDYGKITEKIDSHFLNLAEADTHYTHTRSAFSDTVAEVYVKKDGEFVPVNRVFDLLKPEKQKQLKDADAWFVKTRAEVLGIKEDYLKICSKAEKSYEDYQKLKKIAIRLEDIISKLPEAAVKLKLLKQ